MKRQVFPYLSGVFQFSVEPNYRCATTVITLLNNIRSDIKQIAAKTNSDGTIINKTGSAIFVYSTGDFDLDSFRKNKLAAGWDFDDPKRTKVLFLTHRLIAKRIGFADLLQAFTPADRLIGNNPDKLASHLLKIGEILYFFERKKYAAVIGNIHKKIKTNTDKKAIGTVLAGILSDTSKTIETVINTLDQERLLRKDERLDDYIEKHLEIFDKVKVLPLSQLRAYYDYYNEFSAYSTQHGIKGAEFDNVLVIMENGGWNNYNFKYYFEKTADKESIIARTERIFNVCC
jgi:DNA helicase-2/ATP-dependent DNA helicase PcrA